MTTLHTYAKRAPAPYAKALATLARETENDFLDMSHKVAGSSGETYRIPCLDNQVIVEKDGEIELVHAFREQHKRPHVVLTYQARSGGYDIRLYLGKRRVLIGVLFQEAHCERHTELDELTAFSLSQLLALDVAKTAGD